MSDERGARPSFANLQTELRNLSFLEELVGLARQRAREAYDVGDRELQGRCILEHLDGEDHARLQAAHRFECPLCGRLLKHRRTEVESVD